MDPGFQIQIEPDWQQIPGVRRKSVEFLKKADLPRDTVDAVAMIVCELTENAIKYGRYSDGAGDIHVRIQLKQNDITAEVSHPVNGTDEDNLTRLDRTIQWIRGYQDPFEAYLQRLKELSIQGLENTESRLGLVRIAYEGQGVLDFYVNEQNVLAVSAIRRR